MFFNLQIDDGIRSRVGSSEKANGNLGNSKMESGKYFIFEFLN